MANNQKEVDWSKTTLSFNGHEYQLSTLLKVAATGPKIEVPLAEIDLEPKSAELIASLKPNDSEIHEENIVLFKHQNKYLVLAGSSHVVRAKTNNLDKVKGSLLSTPALKKSRIVKEVPAPKPAPTTNPYETRYPPRQPYTGTSRYR